VQRKLNYKAGNTHS